MLNWKSIMEGLFKKAIVDGTDQALVAGAAAAADVVCRHLKGKSAVRFAGLFFSEVQKRSGIDRKSAIELIPI